MLRNGTLVWCMRGLAAALLCGVSARSRTAERQVVLLYDDAHLSAEMMTEAEEWASRVMRDSEVELQWPSCSAHPKQGSSDCREYYDREPLIVQVLPFGNEFPNKTALAWSSVGANGRNQRAVVFMDRLRKFMDSDAPSFSLGRMLGYVIAHEMGHLLLAQVGHSRSGIMSGPWSSREFTLISRGQLRFDYPQGKQMREEVRRRASAVLATTSPGAGLRPEKDRKEATYPRSACCSITGMQAPW